MSGGHFDYQQYRLHDIAQSIEEIIAHNNVENEYGYSYGFSEETLEEFRKAVDYLKIAEVYVQRVDWLVSGDDGEDDFHKRLKKELQKIVAR